MKVGLISDIHGLMRPEALAALRSCAHIEVELHIAESSLTPELVPLS